MVAGMTTIAIPESEQEHPVVAWIAIAAIACTIVLIVWARFEVHGTGDLEAALYEEPVAKPAPMPPAEGEAAGHQAQVDEAVAASRWATAFSP
jgi:hypothetical protein